MTGFSAFPELGCLDFGFVDAVVGYVAEERALSVSRDERDRSLRDLANVMPITFVLARRPGSRFMGSQYIVESLGTRVSRSARPILLVYIQMPFAEVPSCIPGSIQRLGDREFVQRQLFCPFRRQQFSVCWSLCQAPDRSLQFGLSTYWLQVVEMVQ